MNKIIGLFLLVFLISACERRTTRVLSSAMKPTMPKGSLCLIDSSAYKKNSPRRFDIVAFTPPKPYLQGIWVFRTIGLPKEKIEITNLGVFINGNKLVTPNNLKYLPLDGVYTKLILRDDEYYLMGDNTKNANDSRYIGPIKRKMIFGKMIKILED